MSTTTVMPAVARVEFVDDGKTVTAPADHPYGRYLAGEKVLPKDATKAHLRTVAGQRTPSGKVSAEAKRAQAELTRCKTNRQAKRLAMQIAKDLA